MSRSSSCSSFTWHLIYVDALSASLNIYCNFINYFFANFFLLSHSFPALRHPLLFAVDTHTQDLYVSRCDFLMEHRVEHRANCPCPLPSLPLCLICSYLPWQFKVAPHSHALRAEEGARERGRECATTKSNSNSYCQQPPQPPLPCSLSCY